MLFFYFPWLLNVNNAPLGSWTNCRSDEVQDGVSLFSPSRVARYLVRRGSGSERNQALLSTRPHEASPHQTKRAPSPRFTGNFQYGCLWSINSSVPDKSHPRFHLLVLCPFILLGFVSVPFSLSPPLRRCLSLCFRSVSFSFTLLFFFSVSFWISRCVTWEGTLSLGIFSHFSLFNLIFSGHFNP